MRKITCTACGEIWQCMTGCGLQHGKLENAASSFREEVQKEIFRHVGEMEFPLFDFAYELSYCSYCNRIESIPVLRFLESRTDYVGECPVCKREVELIQDIRKKNCPICGRAKLKSEETGQWD